MFEEIKKQKILHLEKEHEKSKKTVEYVVDLIETNSLDKIFKNYGGREIYLRVERTLNDLYLNYPFSQPGRKRNELSERFGWETFSPEPNLTNVGRAVLNRYRNFIGESSIEDFKKKIEKGFHSLSDDLE